MRCLRRLLFYDFAVISKIVRPLASTRRNLSPRRRRQLRRDNSSGASLLDANEPALAWPGDETKLGRRLIKTVAVRVWSFFLAVGHLRGRFGRRSQQTFD